jgi:cell division septal protein FtsQ
MGRRVGPKNKKKRTSSMFDDFEGWDYLPSNFSWLGSLFRKTGIVLLIALVGFLMYDFYRFGMTSETFAVQLTVRGNNHVPTEEVKTALRPTLPEEAGHDSLLGVSAQRVQDLLSKKIPRFKDVYVLRRFPNELVVEVSERVPVAIVARYDEQEDRRIFLPAGPDGVLFQARTGEWERLKNTLPVVMGIEELEVGSSGFERRWERAMRVKNAFEAEFVPEMLNWIRIRPGGYATIQIERSRPIKVKLGLSDYDQKFARLDRMMMTEEFQKIEEYVNLRDLGEVLVN